MVRSNSAVDVSTILPNTSLVNPCVIAPAVSVQCGFKYTTELDFTLVSFSFTTDHFVYKYFYLALVVESAQGLAKQPVL